MRYSIFLPLAIACSPSFNKVGNIETENSSEYGEEEYDFFTESGLPDLRPSMNATHCENEMPETDPVVEVRAYVATSYFLGTFVNEGDGSWYGKERWYLFPNSTWAEEGGEPCYVTWEVAAQETDAIGCPSAKWDYH